MTGNHPESLVGEGSGLSSVLRVGISTKPAVKRRADQLLVEQGLADSRAKGQALILAGLVVAGDRRIEKPGQELAKAPALAGRGRGPPWGSARRRKRPPRHQ